MQTLEPPVESILDAGARYVRTGSCTCWEDSYRLVEGPWIAWLRKASRRPNLFLAATIDGEFFLGSWVFKPAAGPNLACFTLIENLGKTSPDHEGPRKDRPDAGYLLERLRSQDGAERDAKALSVKRNDNWAEKMRNERQHNVVWAKLLRRRSSKWAQILASEIERGLTTMGGEE